MVLLLYETWDLFLRQAGRSSKPCIDGGHIPLTGLLLAALPPIGTKPIDVIIATDFRGGFTAIHGVLSTVQLAYRRFEKNAIICSPLFAGYRLFLDPVIEFVFQPADCSAASELNAGREFTLPHQLVDLGFLNAGLCFDGWESCYLHGLLPFMCVDVH
jgi:hypothetical protein